MDEHLWQDFARQEQLTEQQLEQFKRYTTMLLQANERINLTSITKIPNIIMYHFQDSLRLADCMSLDTVHVIADIGSGAGFPAIPLKIKYPHVSLVLIEVTLKKVAFLETVVRELGLSNVTVCPLDWRTFLRTTDYTIDLFVSRAALDPHELVRMYQPSCRYNTARLVYWASRTWQPDERLQVLREHTYSIADRTSRLVLLGAKKS